jgi:hypothetical protein
VTYDVIMMQHCRVQKRDSDNVQGSVIRCNRCNILNKSYKLSGHTHALSHWHPILMLGITVKLPRDLSVVMLSTANGTELAALFADNMHPVPDKPFQSSLMFAIKDGTFLRESPFQPLIANIRLGWKGLPGISILAYVASLKKLFDPFIHFQPLFHGSITLIFF